MKMRILAGTLTLGLLTGACGSSDTTAGDAELPTLDDPAEATGSDDSQTEEADSAVDAAPPEEIDPEEAFAQFEACMAEHGIPVSGGVASGGAPVPADEPDELPDPGLSPEQFEEAHAECEPILDAAFGSFDLDPEQEAEQADMMLALQRCLADRGFEIEMQGNAFSIGGDMDFETFDTAFGECNRELGIDQEQP